MQELESWREEKQSAYLYRALAEHESGTTKEGLFRAMAGAAERQAGLWAEAIRRRGGRAPEGFEPGVRARLIARLVRVLGPRRLCTVMAAMKIRGMSVYTYPSVVGHAVPGGRGEHRHSVVGSGGNLRAAVFGVSDGLVSNAALILGVSGAEAEPRIVLLTGVAGLLAGSFSMAAGEFVSVRSQRELYEHQIRLEREELEEYPEEEARELSLIYQARGLEAGEAERLAQSLIADPDVALDTLAREELGLNPDDLASPWGAASASFVAFAAGALIPLLPFLFGASGGRVLASIAVTAAALFGVGALLSLFTGRSALLSGLRMLAIGSAAGALTYVAGAWLGVALA
jgi:VIT1/CCC1 family predicted Fe2+/Mn2+ transporter